MRRLACFVALFAAAGCMSTETTPFRYWVPLADNSAGPGVAAQCVNGCRATHISDSPNFYSCLQSCPGVEVSEGEMCSGEPSDVPPVAFCATELERHEEFDPQKAEAVLELIENLTSAAASISNAAHSHEHHRPVAVVESHPSPRAHRRRIE